MSGLAALEVAVRIAAVAGWEVVHIPTLVVGPLAVVVEPYQTGFHSLQNFPAGC